MSNQFIQPNWHVILIHYPLALLSLGAVIELLAFLWHRGTLRLAGRWMLLLGALSCLPAITSGMYAFRSEAAGGGVVEPDQTWAEIARGSAWSGAQWELMSMHVETAVVGAAVVLGVVLLWLAGSDLWRERLHALLLVLLLGGLAVLLMAAWHSGEAIYKHGTAVAVAPMVSEAETHHGAGSRLEYYIPPLQLHVFLAGCMMSIALAALAVTLRRWNQVLIVKKDEGLAEADRYIRESVMAAGGRAVSTAEVGGGAGQAVYPARFWVLSFVLAALAAVCGLWSAGDWSLDWARRTMVNPSQWVEQRRLSGHLILGATLIFLPLLLAALTRVSRRARFITALLALLLLVCAAGQLWVGTLMLFDSNEGSLRHWNPPATRPA